MEKNNLSVKDVNPVSVEDSNSDQLIEALTNGVVALEATLFTQASLECQRLQRLSSALNYIEEQILDSEVIDTLSYKEKLALYREARKTQQMIISFLQHLHNMALGTKEILDLLKQYQGQLLNKDNDGSDLELSKLRYLLAKVIRKKKDEQA